MTGEPYSISPILGINTQLPVTQLAVRKGEGVVGHFVADAVNVDITDSGTAQARRGYSLALAGAGWRDLFELEDGTALALRAGTLYQLAENGDGLASAPLYAGLGTSISCAQTPGGAVISDGEQLLVLRGGTVAPLTMPAPPAPAVTVEPDASLPGGQYQIALSYADADGAESALGPRTVLQVPNGSAVVVHVPAGMPAGALDCCVYMSDANGDLLFYAGKARSSSLTIPLPATGAEPPTARKAPIPAGSIVRYGHGRLMTAQGTALFLSEHYAPALHDPVSGYLLFPAPVTILAPVAGGTFICADKTYFLSVDGEALREVLPFGAPAGSEARLPDGSIGWFSSRGLVRADAQGNVTLPTEEVLAAPEPTVQAITAYREDQGLHQFIVTTKE